jgi:hypothetical protein
MSNYGDIVNAIVDRLKTELTYLSNQVYPISERSEVYSFSGMRTPFVLVHYSGGTIRDGHDYEDQDHTIFAFIYKHGWDKNGAGIHKAIIPGDKSIPTIVNDVKKKLDLYMFYTELPNYIYHAAAQSFSATTTTAALGIPDEFYHNSGGVRMLYQVEERNL